MHCSLILTIKFQCALKLDQVQNLAMSSDYSDKCAICHEATSGRGLQCNLCDRTFHGVCVKIPEEAFEMLMKWSDEIGWVCKECRLETRHTICALKSEHAKLAEEVSRQTTANKLLTERVLSLEQSLSVAPVTWNGLVYTDTSQDESRSLALHEVVTEMLDGKHQQNNDIITGIETEPAGYWCVKFYCFFYNLHLMQMSFMHSLEKYCGDYLWMLLVGLGLGSWLGLGSELW